MSLDEVAQSSQTGSYVTLGAAYVNLWYEIARVRANGCRFSFTQRVNDALFGEAGRGDWELSKYEDSANLVKAVEPWISATYGGEVSFNGDGASRIVDVVVVEMIADPIKRIGAAKKVSEYSKKLGWGTFFLSCVASIFVSLIFVWRSHLVHSGGARDLGGVPVAFISGGGLTLFAIAFSLLHVAAYFFKSRVFQELVDEKFFSLSNPKFVSALVRQGGVIGLSPKLREELGVVRSGLGLSDNGYDVINALAGEWELSFKELLNTANSLGR